MLSLKGDYDGRRREKPPNFDNKTVYLGTEKRSLYIHNNINKTKFFCVNTRKRRGRGKRREDMAPTLHYPFYSSRYSVLKTVFIMSDVGKDRQEVHYC